MLQSLFCMCNKDILTENVTDYTYIVYCIVKWLKYYLEKAYGLIKEVKWSNFGKFVNWEVLFNQSSAWIYKITSKDMSFPL